LADEPHAGRLELIRYTTVSVISALTPLALVALIFGVLRLSTK
jgi:hypothetical protein